MQTDALDKSSQNTRSSGWRGWLNTALFDLDSRVGRNVNLFGIAVIVVTVVLSMIGTLQSTPAAVREAIHHTELLITVAFAVEYVLRIVAARRPLAYILSFYGLIDLLTWLPLLLVGDSSVAIRLLRILRLLKLIRYLRAMHLFLSTLRDAIEIMVVVVFTMLIVVAIAGNLIHALEPQLIPDAFIGSWWSLVTMTTVGYGDIVPATTAGKVIASLLMIAGITLFAMLTGTISVKIASIVNNTHQCNGCASKIADDFGFCPHCGIEQPARRQRACPRCAESVAVDDRYCSHCGLDQTS